MAENSKPIETLSQDQRDKINWDMPFDMTPVGSEDTFPIHNTNETVACTLQMDDIEGNVDVGDWESAIECINFELSAQKSTVVGENGQLLSSGRVIITDLVTLLRSDSFSGPAFQAAFNGTNVGTATVATMRNIGDTAQTAFQLSINNGRIKNIEEGVGKGNVGDVVRINFGFESIEMEYNPIDDTAEVAGSVGASFDLTVNAALE